MSGTVLALVVLVLGLAASGFWFGVSRRRKAEIDIGVHSLANLKWRDCITVVLEALHREGYLQSVDSTSKGGGADTEFLLSRGDDKVLLAYKHGTAYHLSEINVREFVNALHMRGARNGILVTLGSVTPIARRLAESHDVEVIDGESLWLKVRHFIQPQLLEMVRAQAAAQTRKGLWTGAAASILVAAAIYVVLAGPKTQETVAAESVASFDAKSAPMPATSVLLPAAPRSDAAMLRQINATARAMAEVAKLSTGQLAKRRADAARTISLLPQVGAANWSAQRTLLITLNQTDGRDKDLIEEVCRILTQNEEMRFTRLQLQAPDGSGLPVRWRLCE
jgi:hypothetical protein